MRFFSLQVIAVFLFVLSACTKADNWQMMSGIEKEIKTTMFPADTFNIKDFGAVSGDSLFLNTTAINSAVEKCSRSGGGVVLVPQGQWLTGPVTLKSNVNLHIAENATLIFSTDKNLYLPSVLTRWEGIDCYNIHPLIYANEAVNIALTGKGTINGQASDENWWWMNGNPEYGWKEGMISQKTAGRPVLLGYEQNEAPVTDRFFSLSDALRPQLINFYNCNTVLIEGLTIRNSPFWVIHPLLTKNFILRNATIISNGPNSDGCDPESCENVIIEDCFFDTGDDCIAIKSGRNNDGRRWNIPSKNIIVRNCRMAAGHGGVVIGSEISGGFSNLFVENCQMDSPELLRVIRIKTSNCRGGLIENINVRNITVGQCQEALLHISLLYEPEEKCNRSFPPYVKNVTLENITSQGSEYGIFIEGLDESINVADITVKNCSFNGVKKDNFITGAERIRFINLKIDGKTVKN
jgi:polygalacturonase